MIDSPTNSKKIDIVELYNISPKNIGAAAADTARPQEGSCGASLTSYHPASLAQKLRTDQSIHDSRRCILSTTRGIGRIFLRVYFMMTIICHEIESVLQART